MPYVPLALLEAAIDGLRGKHPLAVLVVPTMVRAGVPVTASPDEGAQFGSEDEVDSLKTWFQMPGAPEDKPFRAIWEDNRDLYWRDERYPGRSLQRIRTDRVKNGRGFLQKKAKPKDLWALRPACGGELVEGEGGYPVRFVDLAIWYGREQDVADLDALIKWFLDEFPIEVADLIGTVYSDEVPAHYAQIPLAPEPLTQTDYAEAVGAAPLPVSFKGSLDDFVGQLEECLNVSGFISTPGFVSSVVRAWTRGDIVVLVGLPGTGKTMFAHTIAGCLKKLFPDLTSTWVPVRPDFEEPDLIGYERLDGGVELREFARSVLQSDQPLGTHLVVLEEFNLAPVETYLASILIASQDPDRRVPLPAGGESHLPQDALILATCNSYLDEPESRLRLSYATKRRASTITMPNVLYERFEQEQGAGVIAVTLQMIAQERARIEHRKAAGLASALDDLRLSALATINAEADIEKPVWDRWVAICTALLGSPEGQEFLTVGLARDVALALAFSERSAEREFEALGRAVADKLLHQLRGPKARADELLEAIGELPNRAEIVRLVDRMKSGPGDALVPIV